MDWRGVPFADVGCSADCEASQRSLLVDGGRGWIFGVDGGLDGGDGDGGDGAEAFGAVFVDEDDGEVVGVDAEVLSGGELVGVRAGVDVFAEGDLFGAGAVGDDGDEDGVALAEFEVVAMEEGHLLAECGVVGVGSEENEGAGVALELQDGILRERRRGGWSLGDV